MTLNLSLEQVDSLLPRIQMFIEQIYRSESPQAASRRLVDGLCDLLVAHRVSHWICDASQEGPWVLQSVSGAPHADPGSQATEELTQRANRILQPLRSPSPDTGTMISDEESKRALAWRLPFGQEKTTSMEAVLVEWLDNRELQTAPARLKYIAAPFTQAWVLCAEKWAHPGRSQSFSRPKKGRRLYRYLASLAVLVAAFLPIDFTITADGYLEPERRDSVYAPCDGYLESILVHDGSELTDGQMVGKMQSPEMEMRIEEVLGQIRSVIEKRNALRIALNQIAVGSKNFSVEQNRISSEILLADLHEKNLKSKLEFLRQEESKLTLRSPIQGTVTANELLEEMRSRPLRRGDPLFDVLDVQGPWHLVLRIDDADSLLVKNAIADRADRARAVFESLPDRVCEVTIQRCNDIVENPDNLGPFVRAYGSISDADAKLFYVNAKAKVAIQIGKRPVWYVWLRPIWETLQKYTLLWK
jgi:hypothetical protein